MSQLDRYEEMAAVTDQVRIVISGFSASIYRQVNGKWWSTITPPEVEFDTLPEVFVAVKDQLIKKAAEF